MPLPLLAIIGWAAKTLITCAVCGTTCYCAKKAYDGYKKGQETKQGKFALKGKELDQLRDENKKAREEEKKVRDELEEQERKNKELERDLEQARKRANDSTLSEEERAQWRRKIVVLEEQLSDGKSISKSLYDKLKKITETISDNNKTISGISSNIDDKHWVWDLFTLDNILIAGGCYLLYKMVKDDK